ncbi:MAG: CRISPR-associated endonuclease Cas3'' [Cardiobacterium sp.]
MPICYAHSAENRPESDWQTLKNHAENVAALAAQFAEPFGAAEIARYTALLHDLGKYSEPFQNRLRGGKRVDHATAGAKEAIARWKITGKLMAFCIAGHHAGLANGSGEGHNRSTLKERLAADIPALNPVWQAEIPLPEKIPLPPLKSNPKYPGFAQAFFTRMLYSCLVDADYLDTEAFYARLDGKTVARGGYPALGALQQAFNQHLQNVRADAKENSEGGQAELNRLRSDILDHAQQQAALPSGLFTLTVPTGGGKTYTSMAFALEHARQHGQRRIIYVIPFTSIIEQNAAAFRDAFGDLGEAAVLEHHSTFDDRKLQERDTRDKLRHATENWDAPIVVTTAVQFFESLFADRSSRCRKLHNIANSVIILDEAQMLPLHLLRPVMAAIDELARNYRCTAVMCTATQPAISADNGFYGGFSDVREIAPDPARLYTVLRRTTVRHIGNQSDAELLEHLTAQPQLLIIVNNRRHARSLYDSAKPLDGVYHLTTLMCAEHRSEVLKTIRARLKAGAPCRLIATSLIEAGVDVSFPRLMRAEAGADSIAQAAGRCNRENLRTADESEVLIFRPEEQWKAPPELATYAACMRETLRNDGDLLAPEAMIAYFRRVYDLSDLDKHHILEMLKNAGSDFPFQTIAEKSRVIESNHMLPLLIPYDVNAEAHINALEHADTIGGLLRQLQRYTVQVPESALKILFGKGRVNVINKEKFGEQFYALIGTDLYDAQAGLNWDNPDYINADNLCI